MKRPYTAALACALALTVSALTAGCGDGGAADAAESSELRVGYQRFAALSLVKARKAEAPGTTWSLFESGPALSEGLKAGAIDIGEVGEAPPIFAAAGKIDFKIVATSAPVPRGEAVLVKESRGFRSFKDLKGKKIGLNKGSNVNWLLVKLLEANGMTVDDVDVKYLKPAEARPAFDNDQIDAWIIWDPYFALAETPGVKVLVDATGLANNREYVLVSPDALEKKPEQVEKFLQTLQQTTAWGIEHPDERGTLLSPELKIPLDTTVRAQARSAQPIEPVNAEIGDEIQEIADGFTDLKLIPGKVDMKSRIDDRFTDVLT